MNNTLSTLGLCKRAGKIITGFDAVVADMNKQALSETRGVIIACDLSEKSKKEIAFHCAKREKEFYAITANMNEIEKVLGKKTGIIAILDEKLYERLKSY